jgi:hypothetical protein
MGLVAQLLGLLGVVFLLALAFDWLNPGPALFGGIATLLISGFVWMLRGRWA